MINVNDVIVLITAIILLVNTWLTRRTGKKIEEVHEKIVNGDQDDPQ